MRKVSRRRVLKAAAYAAPVAMAGRVWPASGAPDVTINLGVREATDLIRTGELKVEDYVGRLIAQENANRNLNTFITIDRTRVLEEARAIDQARSRGQALKPIAGLPFCVKDQIDVAGYPTTAGNPALNGYVPQKSAPCVARLIDAGAIVFGKNNCGDMVGGSGLMPQAAGDNRHFGRICNPYDTSRTPGGSSSGTAAAIAARIVPAGIGEDTGGSVRFPAAHCGISGFRPSTYTAQNALGNQKPKRYPSEGIVPPAGFRETFGPMARTIADCAFLDSVITGDAVPRISLREVRVGIPQSEYWDNDFVDEGVARVMLAAFAKLREAGAALVEVDFESMVATANAMDAAIRQTEQRVPFSTWLEENAPGVTLDDIYAGAPRRAQPRQGTPLSKAEIEATITSAVSVFSNTFKSAGITAVAFPLIPIPPTPYVANGTDAQKTLINRKLINEVDTVSKNIFWDARLGVPGITLPAGLTRGLPVGFGMQGLWGDDSRLLGLGVEIEKVLGPIPPPELSA